MTEYADFNMGNWGGGGVGGGGGDYSCNWGGVREGWDIDKCSVL